MIERLADEITELASQIHAATCRWLGLVAEFDRRRGWAELGCASCAQFVSWRCSIAPGPAREHVRVARRLEELPLIRAAFAAGRLSYSKVRALSRVENVAREQELLALAEHATAAQLERLLRAYRGVVAVQRAAGARPARHVSWDHAEDGSLLLRARLPAEEGAIVLAALEAAVEQPRTPPDSTIDRAGDRAQPASAVERGRTNTRARGDCVPTTTRDQEPAGVPAGTPDHNFADVAAEAPPTLAERRADALVQMADTALASRADARGGDRYQVVLHVDHDTLGDGDGDGDGRCELADGGVLAPETARRLACDAAIVALIERDGVPLSIARKRRSVPPALRRALASRDRGCRFPGCDNRRALDAHHVKHWAHGGPTSLSNLVQLCRFHHRLVHEGGYRVEPAGAGHRFRRPDGRPIHPVPRPPRGRPRPLHDDHRPDPRACVPGWTGDRLDLAAAVDTMFLVAPLEAPGI